LAGTAHDGLWVNRIRKFGNSSGGRTRGGEPVIVWKNGRASLSGMNVTVWTSSTSNVQVILSPA
jgi:hypothetical protein